MHVNSYFIETLVLCFSCGNDNGSTNFGNFGWTNTTRTCSMDSPTRMVIGKQIHWSETVGEQCNNNGPIQYDLPAIKQLVQLQFITPPPSCAPTPTRRMYQRPPVTSMPVPIWYPPLVYSAAPPPVMWYPPYQPPAQFKEIHEQWIEQPPAITPPAQVQDHMVVHDEWLEPADHEGHHIEEEKWAPQPEEHIIEQQIDQVEEQYHQPERKEELMEEDLVDEAPEPNVAEFQRDAGKHDDHEPNLEESSTHQGSVQQDPVLDLVTLTSIYETSDLTVAMSHSLEISSNMQMFLEQNPLGQVVTIITGEETSHPNWPQELHELLITHDSTIPTFVMVVDWSKSTFNDYLLTVDYGFDVAQKLTQVVHDLKIPNQRHTIIGFGTSSHVAGYVGKLTQSIFGQKLYRIIALNPTGLLYTGVLNAEHRLSKNDAEEVLVIHSEISRIGYSEPVGTIDVFVNDANETQPWCGGNASCAHQSAISILMLSIQREPVYVTRQKTNEVLFGFPLDIHPSVNGVYGLLTDPNGVPLLLPPELWPEETWKWHEYPPVDFTRFPDRNVSRMLMVGMGTNESEVILPWEVPSNDLHRFIATNPLAEVFVLITEHPRSNWADGIRRALLSVPEPRYIIIVDWSMYEYPSYVFTVNAFAPLVAEAVHSLVKINHIPTGLTEIIGFSTSAHVAGIVGGLLALDHHTVSRITGLDPEARMWAKSPGMRLSELHATTVQVFHTNSRQWGLMEKLGHYDIYFFGGAEQPDCAGSIADVDSCSHSKALDYYLLSINKQIPAFVGRIQGTLAVQIGDANIYMGYHMVPIAQHHSNIFVVESLSAIDSNSGADPIDLPVDSNNWPPVTFLNYVPSIALNVHYFTQSSPSEVMSATAFFNGRHLGLPEMVRSVANITQNTIPYLIIDGEFAEEEHWTLALTNKLFEKVGQAAVVMRLDWTPYKGSTYSVAAGYSKAVGSLTAQIVSEIGVTLHNLNIIGFSVGAHIAGFIGKEVQLFDSNSVGRISALDPSRPMFDHPSLTDASRLSAGDAAFVDVYHTNILVYGYTDPLGSIDFYINGGFFQPGCPRDDDLCSHYRAVLVYLESLDIDKKGIEVDYAGQGKLKFLPETKFADFGFFHHDGQPGVYYIFTGNTAPYLTSHTHSSSHASYLEVKHPIEETIAHVQVPSTIETKYNNKLDEPSSAIVRHALNSSDIMANNEGSSDLTTSDIEFDIGASQPRNKEVVADEPLQKSDVDESPEDHEGYGSLNSGEGMLSEVENRLATKEVEADYEPLQESGEDESPEYHESLNSGEEMLSEVENRLGIKEVEVDSEPLQEADVDESPEDHEGYESLNSGEGMLSEVENRLGAKAVEVDDEPLQESDVDVSEVENRLGAAEEHEEVKIEQVKGVLDIENEEREESESVEEGGDEERITDIFRNHADIEEDISEDVFEDSAQTTKNEKLATDDFQERSLSSGELEEPSADTPQATTAGPYLQP